MKRRVLYLVSIFLLTMLIFMLAKVVFMLCNLGSQQFSVGDVLSVLAHGFSLDVSTSLYVLALPLLLMMADVWLPLPRWTMKPYYVLVSIVMSLAFVADASLYEFWHFKLDASCLDYLSTPTEAMASVSTGYLIVRVIVFLLLALLIYLAYAYVEKKSYSISSSPSLREGSGVGLAETLFYLLSIPVIVVGIRGGLDESTANIGQVYYSQNQFLNHSAVNPLFSFLSSLDKSGDYIVSYDYFPDEHCRQMTNGLYDTRSVSPDTLLTTRRPNIVLIVMESCGGQFTALGGHPEITPRLNQLADEGVFFSQCYANSWRTDKGVVSILSGYPAFPVTSVMKVPEKSRKLPAIASTLQREGYATSFLYGGDINFTNMRGYVMGSGYEQLRWKADYPTAEQRSAQWGVRDDVMFASLLDEIKNEKAHRWMKTLLTLSSHEPWDVPTHELDDEVYNAFNYLDQCVGQFVDSLQQTPQWQDLLLVILPDHGYRYRGIDEATRLYNHIPMIWTGGAVCRPVVIDRLCNQSDLAATLFGQMGIAHDEFTFSRDVVSRNYAYPLAFHTSTSCMSIYDSTGFVAYDLDASAIITQEGEDAERLLRLSKAILQLTSHDLKAK